MSPPTIAARRSVELVGVVGADGGEPVIRRQNRPAQRGRAAVARGHGVDTEALNPGYFKAAGQPKTRWEIPESKHVGGLAARPAEYERRVIRFLDDALLR